MVFLHVIIIMITFNELYVKQVFTFKK